MKIQTSWRNNDIDIYMLDNPFWFCNVFILRKRGQLVRSFWSTISEMLPLLGGLQAVHILPSWTRMQGSCCSAVLWTSRRERAARRTAGSSTSIVSFHCEFLAISALHSFQWHIGYIDDVLMRKNVQFCLHTQCGEN